MRAVCKRELRALMRTLRGWSYAAIVLLCAGVVVLMNHLLTGSVHLESGIHYIALAMIPAAAIASADAFHAERRQNTERLLFSLPLKNWQIVLGKLTALCVPVLITGIALCAFPLMLLPFGAVPLKAVFACIGVLSALGIAMMSVGLFVSACTKNAFWSVLATIAVLVLSWFAPMIAALVESVFAVNLGLVIALMIVVFALSYVLSRHAVVSIAMTALVEVPVLYFYLRGEGHRVMTFITDGIRSLSLFDGLSTYSIGLMDARLIVGALVTAALFALFTVLSVANRRQAKRRAL